jgi:hypothetical protein
MTTSKETSGSMHKRTCRLIIWFLDNDTYCYFTLISRVLKKEDFTINTKYSYFFVFSFWSLNLEVQRVCMIIYLFTYISRTNTPICIKLDRLTPWDQEKGHKFGIFFYIFSLSKTSHDGWMEPIRKLLFSKRIFQDKDRNSKKLSWVLFPMKVVSVVRKLSTIKE